MKRFMGLIVSLAILTGLLAGCAKPSTENPSVNESTPSASETSFPNTYVDSLGHEVVLERQPERVVSVFHAMYPDYLYVFGVSPVGVASADTLLNQWAAYRDYTSNQSIVDVGSPTAPNLEKILELEPDLILAAPLHEDIYAELSKIAPTVVLDYNQINSDWKYGVAEFSKLLGKEAEADTAIAKVETAISDAAKKLQDFRSKEETVIFISINDKTIWPYSVSQLQVVYDEKSGLGLTAPEAYPVVTNRSDPISLETLAECNPDHIFLLTDYGDETAKQRLEELNQNSVWTSISAIQNGTIYQTDRSIFAFNSPIATQYGVDFVVNSLEKE